MPLAEKILYTAEQMRGLDRDAIEGQGILGYSLMNQAGQAVLSQIRTRWPKVQNLTIFCGAGNNAGDGYVVARLAHEQGMQVQVLYLSAPDGLSGDAWQAYAGCIAEGVKAEVYQSQVIDDCDLLVDALLGIGLQRQISGLWLAAIEAMNRCDKPVIAVDIPSGIHADTGKAMNAAVQADCTVTFIGLKRGLFTGDAPDYVGDLVLDDLQTSPSDGFQLQDSTCLLLDETIKSCLPRRQRIAHKGQHGHVLVIGGNRGMQGAPLLSGMAALRSGAGLVSIATHAHPDSVRSHAQPELMIHAVESAKQLRPLLEVCTVVVAGPGLGQDSWALSMMAEVIECRKPLLVDADGLNLLARESDYNLNWVLTPHPAEAARLLNESTREIQSDRFTSATRLAKFYGGVAVLKGAGTVISGKTLSLCRSGNPGMATAGMGDILSGIIAALMAQGLSNEQAAQLGVWVHARAADLEAEQHGERGMVATDLLPHIRHLLND